MAVALPSLLAVWVLALSGISAVTTEMRCTDAAREGARAAARGDDGAAAARRSGPSSASVSVTVLGDEVTVVVRATARPVGGSLPGFPVSGRAVSAVEPGAP